MWGIGRGELGKVDYMISGLILFCYRGIGLNGFNFVQN